MFVSEYLGSSSHGKERWSLQDRFLRSRQTKHLAHVTSLGGGKKKEKKKKIKQWYKGKDTSDSPHVNTQAGRVAAAVVALTVVIGAAAEEEEDCPETINRVEAKAERVNNILQ